MCYNILLAIHPGKGETEMYVYYCKKCKADSATPICEHCGTPINVTAQTTRVKWRHIRTPLGDSPTVLGAHHHVPGGIDLLSR